MENDTSTPLDEFLKPLSTEAIVLFFFTFTVSLLLPHYYCVRHCRCCIICISLYHNYPNNFSSHISHLKDWITLQSHTRLNKFCIGMPLPCTVKNVEGGHIWIKTVYW